MSLVSGWFPVATIAVAVAAVLACVPWERPSRLRVLVVAGLAAVVVTLAVVGVVLGGGLLAWPVPWSFAVWFGGIVLALAVAVVSWRHVRWRRLFAPVAVVTSVLAAATLVNADYDYFPTWRALVGTPEDVAAMQTLTHDRDQHLALTHGVLLQLPIAGRVSHFDPRDAWVWVPPAYIADHDLALPVVELLEGSPSDPVDWVRGAGAALTADAYARAHHGLAPFVVMPDENGSTTADTECVDGPVGRVETYLTVDVPAFMRSHFQAATGRDSLAVAGLSEGGTCAAVLALAHPGEYRAFGDYSGLAAPTVAAGVDRDLTTRVLFGGSAARYAAHDPVELLRHHRYPCLDGWFESGADDVASVKAQDLLAGLAARAGIHTESVLVPNGRHDFALWGKAFRDSLAFLAAPLQTGHTA